MDDYEKHDRKHAAWSHLVRQTEVPVPKFMLEMDYDQLPLWVKKLMSLTLEEGYRVGCRVGSDEVRSKISRFSNSLDPWYDPLGG